MPPPFCWWARPRPPVPKPPAPGARTTSRQIVQRATAVFFYDTGGHVVWSGTFPNTADDAVFRQAASVKLTDAQGRTAFEGPVEQLAGVGSSPDAYVPAGGRPVKLEHLIRAVLGYGTKDGSYEPGDHGQHDGSQEEHSKDGSYDGDRDHGSSSSSYDDNHGESGSDHRGSGDGSDRGDDD